MDWTRSVKIVGAGTAFAVLVAWMVPPTTPKPPEQAALRSAAKAHQGTAPEPDRFASSAVPASIYAPSVAQRVEMPRPPATPRMRASMENVDRSQNDDGSPPPVVIDHRYSAEPRRADDDDASDEDRYRAGYGWAADMQVQDPRECRRWRGDSGEDGCLDFLREQYDRDDRERWAGN